MQTPAFALFDTAIGVCGVAWSARGLTAVQLPERDAAATRARLLRRLPGAEEAPPPAFVEAAIAAIVALLAGEPRDLTQIPLDVVPADDFVRRVHAITRAIPPGCTLTYGEVAARAGQPGGAQAVGRAMGSNPIPIVVPCHRVVGSGGKLGGFSAPGGARTKLRLLEIERAMAPEALPLFASR